MIRAEKSAHSLIEYLLSLYSICVLDNGHAAVDIDTFFFLMALNLVNNVMK